jgi:lipooligosaccharide transport system permease protein
MIFLSGVYYPNQQLPLWLSQVASFLPLSTAVDLVRPLLLGQTPEHAVEKLVILMAYCAVGFYVATLLTRKRFSK